MKINKDLIDATLMLSVISLVLVGTTKFDNESTKNLVLAALGLLAIATLILRVLTTRKGSGEGEHSHLD